mmetsp:Transcript_17695/g.24286  ORF Transcript_17695/g.24286 Transcript_17695/m.24286 type:complete len:212 (+) Transcript_17695:35-670(+)
MMKEENSPLINPLYRPNRPNGGRIPPSAPPSNADSIIYVEPFEIYGQASSEFVYPAEVTYNKNDEYWINSGEMTELALLDSAKVNKKISNSNVVDGHNIVKRDREATILSNSDGSMISRDIENKVLRANILSNDICRNNPAIGISVNATKLSPSAPMEETKKTIPGSNITAVPKGYDVSEYRSIYDTTTSTNYNVASGGYQCNEYKSIYDK